MAKSEAAVLQEVAAGIRRDFPGLSASDVEDMVARAHADFAGRPIREFVPLFVERRIRAQLAAGA